jgi:hypothetical protein
VFNFLIISNAREIPTSVYRALSSIGSPREETGGRFIVENIDGMKNGWIAFQPIEDVQFDYEMEEIEKIREIIENPSFYLIEGRNGEINFANHFIEKFNHPGKILIDNDHGLIADLNQIKRKIKLGKDWLHSSS